MSELQEIELALTKAARRRRVARALRGLWTGLLVGAVISLAVLAAYKLLPAPLWTLYLAGTVPIACGLLGLLIGLSKKQELMKTARWVDDSQHLKERLSTALELARHEGEDRWRDLVIADAAEHARKLDPGTLLPLSLTRSARIALPILVLVAGLGFVPEYRSKAHLQKQQDEVTVRQVGKQLSELTRQNLQKRPPTLEQTQKAMEAVAATGDQLARAGMTRAEALKDLANAADKLKDQLKDMGRDPALRRLEQAMRAAGMSDSLSPSEMQKQMEAMQKDLAGNTATPAAMDKLKRDLEKLQEAARARAGNNSGPSQAEKEKIAAGLASLAQQMQDLGIQLPALEDAMKQLAANNNPMVLKDLNAAVNDLEKMRQMAESLQQMQQQMARMGKDLAEQLENGQPEAAHSTLKKMIDQLTSANLSPEQLQKMLQEVKKAVDPAGNYGDVAKHLQNASQQLASGNKGQASQSLADAAKELEKLMDQLGDAQSLAAELRSLNQASMCIANGQCWSPGNRPGSKPGGKPGSGVGTWAEDENQAWNGDWSDKWDNSGIVRPDVAGRPNAQRDASLNENLKPTKVKGQFSPGSQMPSITLKGVSIKGQSTLEFQEAAAAAQSEAQSALSQEKVPRAYQGAVKEYFDDFQAGQKSGSR